jgi:CheY-like chemotaxis protein
MKLIAEACNGQEAIEKFRLHRPDVTLMDLQMPALDGIEAITTLADLSASNAVFATASFHLDVKSPTYRSAVAVECRHV